MDAVTKRLGRPKANVPDACTCAGPCSAACRARRARLARRTGSTQAERKKKRRQRPGPAQSNAPGLCGCGTRCTAACRARRFRAAHPEVRAARSLAYRAAALREDPTVLEHRALAYVRRALARGTIVPPRVCDHCLTPSQALAPFHPDPRRPREIAWLCQNDRRSVPSLGGTLVLGWTWPGVAGESPKPWWRVTVEPAWVAAANDAIAASAPDGRIGDAPTVRRWADAFFAKAPSGLRERIYALARRRRLKTEDPRLERLLGWWATLELESRNRRAHNEREQHEIDVAFEPRQRSRRRTAADDLRSIGDVPMPPSAPAAATPRAAARPPDDELLAHIDASLAEVDAILARFERRQ